MRHTKKISTNPKNKNNSKNAKTKYIKKKSQNARCVKQENDPYKSSSLYPPIKFNQNMMLRVSKIHTLYVETYGNPNGKPVLYVHGGPGAGINPNMARFFNPKKYFIVLVDQRGSGNSVPRGELSNNTTTHLIADFEKVRIHLNIDKWMVYGGSWGSTLSLAYAIKHPNRTTELIIRGVYLCTDQENHWVSEPGGAQRFNPESWEYYKNALPKKYKPDKSLFMNEYAKCFKTGSKSDKTNCMLAWSVWEESISTLNPMPLDEVIRRVKTDKYKQTSIIENAYFTHNCFLPKNFFMNSKNISRLKKIPITIIQGMYDLVTPYTTAYLVHKLLPHSTFYPTLAGHSAMDPENIKHLVAATNLACKPIK